MIRMVFLLISGICLAQAQYIGQQLKDGQQAFMIGDYVTSKDIYREATTIDSLSGEAWFGLAEAEMQLGEKDIACNHFYKSYRISYDILARKNITENCPNFKNGRLMSINDIAYKPEFRYQGNIFPLIKGNSLTNKYKSILIDELKNSYILKDKLKGLFLMRIHIDKNGKFDGRIMRYGSENQNRQIVEKEVTRIFKNTVEYIPAKNNSINIETWESWTVSYDFGK